MVTELVKTRGSIVAPQVCDNPQLQVLSVSKLFTCIALTCSTDQDYSRLTEPSSLRELQRVGKGTDHGKPKVYMYLVSPLPVIRLGHISIDD